MEIKITLYIVIIVFLAIVLVKGIFVFKRKKHLKKYGLVYKSILDEDENAYLDLQDYIKNETSEEFINKAMIFKLYYEVKNNYDCSKTLKKINLDRLFISGKKYNEELIKANCDSFIWIIVLLSQAYKNGKTYINTKIMDLIKSHSTELTNWIEYNLVNSIYKAINNDGNNGIEWLSEYLEGGFNNLKVNKQFSGLYKRFAASTLSFLNKDLDEYYVKDLSMFSSSKLGKI